MKIEYNRDLKRGFLFVCTGNVLRSKTAAALACNKGLSCASAGFEPWRLQYELNDLRYLSYFNHGSKKDIVMDKDAYEFCASKDVKDWEIEPNQQELTPELINESQIVICMNYREHYPMMEKFKMKHNINPHNIMYWDVPDIRKEEGWKGFEDNLDYGEKKDIINMVKDRIDSLLS